MYYFFGTIFGVSSISDFLLVGACFDCVVNVLFELNKGDVLLKILFCL